MLSYWSLTFQQQLPGNALMTDPRVPTDDAGDSQDLDDDARILVVEINMAVD